MAYTITELRESRSLGTGQSAAAELVYQVVESPPVVPPTDAVEKDALDAVIAAAPASFQGMAKIGARIRPIDGRSTWRVTVTYGIPRTNGFVEPLAVGEYRIDFPGGTTNELVTQGYTERRYLTSGVEDGDLGGAINVTDRGAQGVSIEVPEFEWTETWIRDNATASWASIIAIALLRKRVNNAAFRGFAAGEVFFDDFTASPRTDDDWEYRFKFRARANRLDESGGGGGSDNSISIGANNNPLGGADTTTPIQPGEGGYDPALDYTIRSIEKRGWQYLWVRFEQNSADDGNLIERPIAVYVNDVYDYADFSLLGVGTGVLF